MNFRPSERAMDCPNDVLPTPGGPAKHRIGPRDSGASFVDGAGSVRVTIEPQSILVGAEGVRQDDVRARFDEALVKPTHLILRIQIPQDQVNVQPRIAANA